jgi:hypothetical protein
MDALDILKQRLAKGEITEEQYDSLAAKIGRGAAHPPPPPPPQVAPVYVSVAQPAAPAPAPEKKKSRAWIWIVVIFILAIGGGVAWFLSDATEGLNVGNVGGTQGPRGANVSFVLSNTSQKTGDVVFWVTIGEREICHTVMRVGPNSRYNVVAPCPQIQPGEFTLQFFWADKFPEKASLATRLALQ